MASKARLGSLLKNALAGAIVVLAFYYIFKQIAANWEVVRASARLNPTSLVGAALLGVQPLLAPFGWWLALKSLGSKASWRRAYWAWSASNLGKYAPGKVWNILGRFYFMPHEGKVALAESIAVEVFSNLWAASLAATTATLFWQPPWAPVAWAGAAGGLLALAYPKAIQLALRAPAKLLKKELKAPSDFPRRAFAVLTLFYYLLWLALGVGIWLVGLSLGIGANPVILGGAYAVAWMGGYLFLLVPGGFGVREGLFTAMAGVNPGVAGVLAVAVRLGITIWEVLAFGLAFVLRER